MGTPSSGSSSRLGVAAHFVPPEDTWTPPKGANWDDVVIPAVAKTQGKNKLERVAGDEGDLAVLANTGLAQRGGIVVALGVTRLFRSLDGRRSALRLVCRHWEQLARLAGSERMPDAEVWLSSAVDRFGQVSARMMTATRGSALDAVDGLGAVRIGRALLHLRQQLAVMAPADHASFHPLLPRLAVSFDARAARAPALPPPRPPRSSL